jgi:hypothetical protein
MPVQRRELNKTDNLMEGLPMKAYSKNLRQRVLADCDGGIEIRQVAVKWLRVRLRRPNGCPTQNRSER